MAEPDISDIKRRMEATVEALRKELSGLRTGRASAALLEPIQVEAYGSMTPLSQVATVNVPEPRMIMVQVWDKGVAKAVEKAIRDAGLGLNPQGEGTSIRVPVPPLTEERRQELVKVASKYAEQARVAVRNIRRDGMENLKKAEKDNVISQDRHKQLADDVQKQTDLHVKKVDEVFAVKEKEITQL
ncbi:MAG: ribosome recycling factor [Alphaproteobacteria bacterium]